jgi:ribosome maturation protein SDO1
VQEWRAGVETDLDEVLQIEKVFTNVSKGQAANSDELQKCFGKTDQDEIVKEVSPFPPRLGEGGEGREGRLSFV